MQTFKKMVYAIMATVMFISCSKEDNEIEVKQLDPVKDKAIAEAIASSNDKGIPFPEGSKVFKKADGIFTIVLPKNVYYLVANDATSKIYIRIPEIDVNCSCTDGSGCSPLKNNGQYYCVMEPSCKTCDRRVYAKSINVELKGIIDLNGEVSLISSTDKRDYKCMNKEVLNITEVKEGIEKFYLKMYDGEIPSFIKENKEIPSKDYVYVKANVFGYGMILPVLKKKLSLNEAKEIEIISTITCECQAGVGCKKEKAFGGIYCNSGADCVACSMHEN